MLYISLSLDVLGSVMSRELQQLLSADSSSSDGDNNHGVQLVAATMTALSAASVKAIHCSDWLAHLWLLDCRLVRY